MEAIGRYRILGELGRGAMGVVYRAQDTTIGREVAIKTIRLSEFTDDAERQRLRDRLFREAQSAGLLSHPGIVTIYDVAEEGDIAYIAMECVDGPTLDRLITTDPPDGALVLSLLSQTAAALDFAHKRGIVHRDIKPANIMIHEGRNAKITDFGVARLQSLQMTQAGSLVGTPNYMSPEQIQGHAVDGRSDQFSLAVIAYELLTGEKPFAAESIAALAYRIAREKPEDVHQLNPTVDWPVNTVLQRGLAKAPADRYPTCSDFAFALENACRSCRRWRPLPPGASQQMATVAGTPAPKLVPPARVTQPDLRDATPAPGSEAAPTPAPRFLRVLRLLTALMLAVGLAAALVITGLRYLDERRDAAVTAAVSPGSGTEDPGATGAPKPSAMPQAELPGDNTTGPTLEPQPDEPTSAVTTPPAPGSPPEPDETATPGTRLVTNPPGALLVVDGSSDLSCQAPCTLALSKGRHTLAATLDGYRRTLRILEIPKEDEIFLNLDRSSGTVMIRSEPPGAAIFINGDARSERTPAMLTLPVGRYTLDLVWEGRRESQDVQVKDAAITNVAIAFPAR
ncbi:MAG: protein kinase [Bryobacteraceae bacterium]|nr:protein kinase [Bryobacteraceae bacterium]